MKRTDINRDWTLQKGEPGNIPMMRPETRTVHLPHDYMIGSDVTPDSKNGVNGGCYEGAVMSYTKYLDIPENLCGQRILVRFDGCAGLTKVVLNGHVAGRHHYAYTPFTVDITRLVEFGGKNRLTVTCGTDAGPNSRWYLGGGIYRHVQLLTGPMVHLAVESIYAHLSHMVDGDAFVIVETTVENHTGEDAIRWVDLKMTPENCEGPTAGGRICVFVPAGESAVARTTLCVEKAKIWDLDSPNLYKITAELTDGESVTDTAGTIFGIREITVDAKNGFRLNGRSIKLQGGCIHADNGILGAASFYDSEYRKVKLHKENGFNALRYAHNPVSAEMLEACDRLGMLVIDEAFDTWNMQMTYYDFSQFFAQEWETEFESFVKRDRNHPCVIAWSIGNELPEQGGLTDGYKTSAMLSAKVRELDTTRPVAGALCSFWNGLSDSDNEKFWESLMKAPKKGGGLANLDSDYGREIWSRLTEPFCAPWDIVGYNYLDYHYEETGRLFPNRVICATESKPGMAEKYWADVEKYPFLIGDFEWTSHDYIGESGIGNVVHVKPEETESAARALSYSQYPWRLAGCGDFDLCGFEKPQLHFKKIVWGSPETYIAVRDPRYYDKAELVGRYGWTDCAHSWSWPVPAGSPIRVDVYSSAEEVELIVNGVSLGRKPAKNKAEFDLSYEPGVLEAVSYTGGKEISRDKLTTAGAPVKLKLTPEKTELTADGESLCYVRIEAADGAGNPVHYAEAKAAASVTGKAALAAFGTGRPCTEEKYTKGEITLYKGTALAVLRAGIQTGEAVLKVSAEGFGEAELTIPVKCFREEEENA